MTKSRKVIISEYGKRFNVWDVKSGKRDNSHPGSFPESLAEDHILSWSKEGDVVLDPMAGSGTTLVAALNLKRQFIGIEISDEYVDIINKRLGISTSRD